ncbi:MAG TPA: hypothetical protein VEK15_07665 [Vicinamibacteria bacterium]|nr:hypothetical protein [Vicinamibacteria bacterium]
MARACPACSRPNSDTAERCLYCSRSLPPKAEHQVPAPAAIAAERFLLILIPAGEPGEEKLREFSRIAALGLYEARLCLLAKRPRLFRILPNEQRARELSASLGAARVPHYLASEQAVLSMPVSRARRIDLHERHLTISLAREQPLTLRHEDLLLVVRGEIRRERHHEKRLGSARGVSHRLSSGERIHLYEREAKVAVEIEPEAFDWDVLGEERTTSALLNVERFVSRIAAKAPFAAVDRGFDDEPAVLARALEEGDPSHALIDVNRDSVDGVLFDNEAQFRFYARWRYRVERFLSPRPGDSQVADGKRLDCR